MWSVLQRELRAQARNRFNPWLRLVAALATGAVLFGALAYLERSGLASWMGRGTFGPILFVSVHLALCGVLMLVTPLLTADCISREVREGTIGLLGLTPLKPWEILVGKATIHLVRALSLWLATLPVLFIPVLFGGLSWRLVFSAIGWEFILVMTGLSAGLLASCHARRWSAVNGLAIALLAVLLLLIWGMLGGLYGLFLWATPGVASPALESEMMLHVIGQVLGLVDLFAAMGGGPRFSPSERWALSLSECLSGTLVLLGFGVACLHAGRRVALLMVQSSPSPAADARRQFWLTPRFGRAGFQRRRKRRMSSNPILWLQHFAPDSGLAGSGWMFVIVLAFTTVVLLCGISSDMAGIGWFPAPMLMLAVAFASAGSFRREIEEGTLELILVTAITFRRIVAGRVMALWRQFVPAMLLAVVLTFVCVPFLSNPAGESRLDPLGAWVTVGALSSCLALPSIGLRCALRRLNPLFGWPLTLGIGVLAPLVATTCITIFICSIWDFDPGFMLFGSVETAVGIGGIVFLLVQAGVATWWWRMCEWDLATRHFMLRPFGRRHG